MGVFRRRKGKGEINYIVISKSFLKDSSYTYFPIYLVVFYTLVC